MLKYKKGVFMKTFLGLVQIKWHRSAAINGLNFNPFQNLNI